MVNAATTPAPTAGNTATASANQQHTEWALLLSIGGTVFSRRYHSYNTDLEAVMQTALKVSTETLSAVTVTAETMVYDDVLRQFTGITDSYQRVGYAHNGVWNGEEGTK